MNDLSDDLGIKIKLHFEPLLFLIKRIRFR